MNKFITPLIYIRTDWLYDLTEDQWNALPEKIEIILHILIPSLFKTTSKRFRRIRKQKPNRYGPETKM